MTQKEYLEQVKALDKAEESVVPYPVLTEDEVVVVGDANLTELNKHDFTVLFWIPEKQEDGTLEDMPVEIDYKDVHITPRQSPKVVKILSDMYPFYKKVTEDGGLENYTDEEMMKLIASMDDVMTDKMYTLVATTLGVDPVLVDYMDVGSVLGNVAQIFRCVPGNHKRSGRDVPQNRQIRTRAKRAKEG